MLFGEFAAGESPGKQKTAHARQLAPLSVGFAVGDGGDGVGWWCCNRSEIVDRDLAGGF